jgi:hypothetical protein
LVVWLSESVAFYGKKLGTSGSKITGEELVAVLSTIQNECHKIALGLNLQQDFNDDFKILKLIGQALKGLPSNYRRHS